MYPAVVMRRFWTKVNKTSGCWLWTGARLKRGYGSFGVGDKQTRRAHRASWEMANGPIPQGMEVCHQCDTPLCVRPDHLFLGTHRENMIDCMNKGRISRHGTPRKLTPGAVSEMRRLRASGAKLTPLAHQFGVSKATVWAVIQGEIWRQVA